MDGRGSNSAFAGGGASPKSVPSLLGEGPSENMGHAQTEPSGLLRETHLDPPLTKLGSEDDVEVFLKTFECTAEMAHWPEDQWAFLVRPYLTGPSQATLKNMSENEAFEYKVIYPHVHSRKAEPAKLILVGQKELLITNSTM